MKKIFAFISLLVSLQSIGQIQTKQIQDFKPYREKSGNVLGTLYSETGFVTYDTFSTSGITPAIVNSMIVLGDGTSSGAIITLKRYTSLDRWTYKSGFKVGQKNGTSYGYALWLKSSNTTFEQSLYAYFEHRSTMGYDGVVSLNEWNGISGTRIATAPTTVSYSQGDSIETVLIRDVNTFTFIVRNVTTGTPEVSTSYTYNGFTTAVNTGQPQITAVGSDSIYHVSFYSDESLNADLITIGDSKFTWYGNQITQSIPSLLFSKYGNVVNTGKSGDKTAEVVATLDEKIALNAKKWLVTIGSNDLRNGISSGTWQANIDTIYNRGTRSGADVYFDLMFETSQDQSALITYLSAAYPTKYIGAGYAATRDCKSCLLADNIHMTAYGNRKFVDAIAQSGMIDFFNPFREMKFTAGDVGYIDAGDSLIINEYFRTTNKLNIWIDGEFLWGPVTSYEPNSYEIRHDSLILHGPLSAGDRVVIQTYNHVMWANIPGEPPPTSYLLTDYPNAEIGYSVRKLKATYLGSCLRVRRSSDNTEQDIGFVSDELDTASMKIFVGANSAYVTKWYNQASATSGSDAVQTTSGQQPRIMNSGVIDRVQNTNGDWMVSVLFDGTDDWMSFGDEPAAAGADWSSFMVQKRTAAGEYGGVIACNSTGPATTFFSNIFSANNLEIARCGAAAHPFYKDASDATATYCLLSGFVISNVSSGYKNGSSISFGGEVDAGFTAGGVFNQFGKLGSSIYSHAYISEAIIYLSDQSSNRTSIETNINNFFHQY
jgi:hypothetical protein